MVEGDVGRTHSGTDDRRVKRRFQLQVDAEHCRFGDAQQRADPGSRTQTFQLGIFSCCQNSQHGRSLSDVVHGGGDKDEAAAGDCGFRQQLRFNRDEAVVHAG